MSRFPPIVASAEDACVLLQTAAQASCRCFWRVHACDVPGLESPASCQDMLSLPASLSQESPKYMGCARPFSGTPRCQCFPQQLLLSLEHGYDVNCCRALAAPLICSADGAVGAPIMHGLQKNCLSGAACCRALTTHTCTQRTQSPYRAGTEPKPNVW